MTTDRLFDSEKLGDFKWKLASGKVLEIVPLSVKESMNLIERLTAILRTSDISQDIQVLYSLISSGTLNELGFKCVAKSTLNRELITEKLFEPIKDRADLFPVLYLGLMEHILPFFPSLESLFLILPTTENVTL